jgi:hypothetical protein
MSLGVVIKGAEGIVLAADSRVTLDARPTGSQASFHISYDNATKVLAFSKQPFIGAVTYGAAVIKTRTAYSLLPEFEVELEEKRLSVAEFAAKLSTFFLERWKADMPKGYGGAPMTFVVAGYDPGKPYGEVHLVGIPNSPEPQLRTAVDGFGMTWGGQLDIVSRIIHGFDPNLSKLLAQASGQSQETVDTWFRASGPQLALTVPYEFLPLQDCINLATAMIRTTMVFQDTAVRLRGVGGPIDIAVITRTKGLRFVQKKKLMGEMGYAVEGGTDDEGAADVHDQRAAATRKRPPRRTPRTRH